MSPFEAIMLFCFGASWPFAIVKTYQSKHCGSKSFLFMWLLLIGYASGIVHKLYYHYDAIIFLYILNFLLVASDLGLCYYYKLRKQK